MLSNLRSEHHGDVSKYFVFLFLCFMFRYLSMLWQRFYYFRNVCLDQSSVSTDMFFTQSEVISQTCVNQSEHSIQSCDHLLTNHRLNMCGRHKNKSQCHLLAWHDLPNLQRFILTKTNSNRKKIVKVNLKWNKEK